MLLHELLVFGCGPGSGHRFRLGQLSFARSTSMPVRVDAFRVPFVLHAAYAHAQTYLKSISYVCLVVTSIPRSEKAREHLAAHVLNSFPCGLFVTPLTMKLARWQNSWAMTFRSRCSTSITFSANSIDA